MFKKKCLPIHLTVTCLIILILGMQWALFAQPNLWNPYWRELRPGQSCFKTVESNYHIELSGENCKRYSWWKTKPRWRRDVHVQYEYFVYRRTVFYCRYLKRREPVTCRTGRSLSKIANLMISGVEVLTPGQSQLVLKCYM